MRSKAHEQPAQSSTLYQENVGKIKKSCSEENVHIDHTFSSVFSISSVKCMKINK